MKKVKRLSSFVSCLALSLAVLCFGAVQESSAASDVIRIGVMRFASRAQGLEQQQAEAITDLFTRMLSNSQSIAVIERDRLDMIGSEHKLNMSGLVDPSTAAELGRLAGCQYILLGAVTQFDKKSQTTGLLGIIKTTTQEAKVTIDMRVVNVETGEVVLTMAETGTASDQSSGFNYYIQVEDSRLEGLEGEAVANAVAKLGLKLKESVADEYAQIVAISGKDITLNIGASLGARKGGLYLVYADGPEVRDINGRSLGRKNIDLAVVKVIDVQSEFCEAQVVDNGGKLDVLRRGDKVTPISGGDAKKLASQKAFVSERPRKMGVDFDSLSSTDTLASLPSIPEPDPGYVFEDESAAAEIPDTDEGPEAAAAQLEPEPAQSPADDQAAQTIAPPAPEPVAQTQPLENESTDPGKVVVTYPLTPKDANFCRIGHINYRKLGRTQAAYDKFVELLDTYSCDYLAAYWLGEISVALKKNDQAAGWYDKALAINPNYVPAQKAKAKLNK